MINSRPRKPNVSGAPVVTLVIPNAGTIDIPVTRKPSATFDRAMLAGSISGSTFEVRLSGNLVSGSVAWDSTANRATFTPTLDLVQGGVYTCKVIGGSSGVKAANGTPMAADYSWSFTTTGAPEEGLTVFGWASGSGFKAAVTGGDGGSVYQVTDTADYLAKLALNETRIIDIRAANNIVGAGQIVDINNGNLTIIGSDFHGSVSRLGHRGKCNNVKVIDLRYRPGDNVNSADDVDGFTISGTQGHRERWLFEHCSMAWGPDIAGLAILDDVTDVTAQFCAFGPGLANSAHSEGDPAVGTHHKTGNITTIGTAVATVWPERISYIECVFIGGEDRNPQMMGPAKIDLINTVHYNAINKNVHGNPRSLNMVGCMVKEGPSSAASSRYVFRSDTNNSNPTPHAASVFLGDGSGTYPATIALGFTYAENFDAGVERGTPNTDAMYAATAAVPNAALLNAICDEAGARPRDSIDTTLLDQVKAGTWAGDYMGLTYGAIQCTYPAPF